jgi:transposase-like protein
MARQHKAPEQKAYILGLIANGAQVAEVARESGVARSTIYAWMERMEAGSLQRKVTVQPKRATTNAEDAALVAESQRNPFHTARQVLAVVNTNCSVKTVQRRLRDVGNLKCCSPAEKEDLNAAQMAARVNMANTFLAMPPHVFERNCIFTDEKVFSSTNNGKLKVWRPQGQRYNPNYVRKLKRSGRFSIHVWGALSGSGLQTLVEVPTKGYDRHVYLDVLGDNLVPLMDANPLPPGENYYFIQDNAPIHSSRVVKHWLEEQDFTTLPWAPRSPDANVIENAWGLCANTIKQNHLTSFLNIDSLRDAVFETWEEKVTPQYCQQLTNSFRRRLQMIIDCGGGWIKY